MKILDDRKTFPQLLQIMGINGSSFEIRPAHISNVVWTWFTRSSAPQLVVTGDLFSFKRIVRTAVELLVRTIIGALV